MVSLQKMNSFYKAKLELADGAHNGEEAAWRQGNLHFEFRILVCFCLVMMQCDPLSVVASVVNQGPGS